LGSRFSIYLVWLAVGYAALGRLPERRSVRGQRLEETVLALSRRLQISASSRARMRKIKTPVAFGILRPTLGSHRVCLHLTRASKGVLAHERRIWLCAIQPGR
jgi:hypothetical protein